MASLLGNNSQLTEVKGLEKEPEGGARCRKCFEMRLDESARICREKGLDYFTTTLTISPSFLRLGFSSA